MVFKSFGTACACALVLSSLAIEPALAACGSINISASANKNKIARIKANNAAKSMFNDVKARRIAKGVPDVMPSNRETSCIGAATFNNGKQTQTYSCTTKMTWCDVDGPTGD